MKKSDFPVFTNNLGLVYLDSAASSQKPAEVIDGVAEFLRSSYSNIHRGHYSLSEKSEELFFQSKKMVAKLVNSQAHEVIYTYNSTFAFNLVAQTLCINGKLGAGDVVLLSVLEHHANIVPWHHLSKQYGFTVDFVGINQNPDIDSLDKSHRDHKHFESGHFDYEDFEKKYTKNVKVVSLTAASNVTGEILDLQRISDQLRDETFFIVDGSQGVPHFQLDFQKLGADFLIFTAHKIMADTGLGVLVARQELMKELEPSIVGGGAIGGVTTSGFSFKSGVEKWEPGTPNIVGAVSLLKALEYLEKIGGYQTLEDIEKKLMSRALERFRGYGDQIELIGSDKLENRLGIFSFVLKNQKNIQMVGELFAEKGICVRSG
ncbi:MAG TPA: aminotransferase class V-fold PLP-dependent enzyme, partial [Candidatus Absconditabacterales bacterium]|nr:aminotransferase class V-fold PLP-dependent enzyme [Candidatus Absconditabacterales bacterium]